jgi:hypothetical protein
MKGEDEMRREEVSLSERKEKKPLPVRMDHLQVHHSCVSGEEGKLKAKLRPGIRGV